MAQREPVFKDIDITLRADASRTVVRPFMPEDPQRYAVDGKPRGLRIVERILALDATALDRELAEITGSLDHRHRDVDASLLRRFDDVRAMLRLPDELKPAMQRLIGAYFSQEYSFEAAALFNPSVVPHPDQSGLAEDAIRIVLSLRGIGEGHVSSVTFRTGIWRPGHDLVIDDASQTAVPPIIDGSPDGDDAATVRLHCGGSLTISETVLFPVLPRQARGIEDLRLCRFMEDDGDVAYHGTYTAFDGVTARSELLSGSDFRNFVMRPMHGDMADAKGMALFPRRIDGRYWMLGRQDNENIWLSSSDDLLSWPEGRKLLEPRFPWEFIQVGNCGSPIEIEEGWLVFTHGVGNVRNYCIGACLLDREDPSHVLGRTPTPLIEPTEGDRDGYVPNVVYSCGAMVAGRHVLLPYGVADSYTTFATARVDDVLAAMRPG